MWRGRSGHSPQRPPCVIAPGSYRLAGSGDSQIRRTGRRRSVRRWLGEELVDDPGGGGEGLSDGFEQVVEAGVAQLGGDAGQGAVLEGAVQVPAGLGEGPADGLPAGVDGELAALVGEPLAHLETGLRGPDEVQPVL